MKYIKNMVFAGAVALALAAVSHAANLASDDASDVAYSGVWTNGSNGGYGFGAWQLTPVAPGPNAGHFIGDSTLNGDTNDDGNAGGIPLDGDINTGVLGPNAWGIYANSGRSAFAIRPFTGGPLAAGQTFSVDFDNGFVSIGSSITVGLLDAFNSPVFQVRFVGGTSNYEYQDSGGTFVTGVPYGDEGLNLTVTMTSPTAYSATLTRFDGVPASWSGTLNAAPEAFGAVNFNAGSGPNFDLFINSMSVVPEPSTIALAALGVLGIAVRALRRREV